MIQLFGANGQVGFELRRQFGEETGWVAPDRDAVDLADPDALTASLDHHRPEVVINAAAYTAVDAAEDDPQSAAAVNATAPAVMARWAADHGAALVHFSTDYVFDGSSRSPITEQQDCRPLGAYGRTKWEGEEAIRDSGCRHLILRTSWVYGARGHNFLLSILRAARQRDALRIVDDQWGSPTWCGDLASRTLEAVADLSETDGWESKGGTYHLSARGETTWFRFAGRFLEIAMQRGLLERIPELHPIATADWPTPAQRPAYSVLDNSRFEQAFDRSVAPWEDQLERCMAGLQKI